MKTSLWMLIIENSVKNCWRRRLKSAVGKPGISIAYEREGRQRAEENKRIDERHRQFQPLQGAAQ
jgi:hypothetical protein